MGDAHRVQVRRRLPVHFIKGSELANRRLENVKETLQRLQLEPERLQTTQLAISEWNRLPVLFNEFVGKIRDMGPNPVQGVLVMPAAILVRPDTDFIRAVLASGGGDLKKCYQCATCSTHLRAFAGRRAFPRQQMIEPMGLKDKLLKDPAIWLCHNCGQCTTYCPRGSAASDVLGRCGGKPSRAFAFPPSWEEWFPIRACGRFFFSCRR